MWKIAKANEQQQVSDNMNTLQKQMKNHWFQKHLGSCKSKWKNQVPETIGKCANANENHRFQKHVESCKIE